MPNKESDIRTKIAAWIGLSRPPFHTVGILPFLLGTFLAWRLDHVFSIPVFTLGLSGVLLVMLSTYHAGEYFDHEEDGLSKRLFHSRFSGGSGVIPEGALPRSVPLWTSLIAIALAGVIGLILQFALKTGPMTLLLGCIGALPGFFYSARPIRLVEKGYGEFFIGFCYGWLPVASAFYIQSGHITPAVHWIALPIGLSIFNVILINEFHDHPADLAVGKANLVVRLGKKKGMILYIAVAILSWFSMHASLGAGIPRKALYLYLPVMFLSAGISLMMARGKYENPFVLEILCGLTIAVNLATTAAYILAFL